MLILLCHLKPFGLLLLLLDCCWHVCNRLFLFIDVSELSIGKFVKIEGLSRVRILTLELQRRQVHVITAHGHAVFIDQVVS